MQTYEVGDEREFRPRSKKNRGIRRLISKYAGLIKAGKFAFGSAIGFLDTELILVLGSYVLYGGLTPPQSASSFSSFWALNAVAFALGVTVAFFVNEMLIARNDGRSRHQFGLWNTITRLVKFQLIFLTGNVIILVVQVLLLREFSVPPYFGNIIGAIVSFPASYFFSTNFVWSSERTIRNQVPRNNTPDSKTWNEYNTRINEAQKILRNFPALARGNFKMKVNEYKFDIIPQVENRTLIDFALNLEVITPDSEKS